MKEGLWLEDVSFRYGDLWVLRETELHVPPGRTLIVTGDNGVGKSTLLYVCAGLLNATAGHVWLDGHLAAAKKPSELMRQQVRRGFLFGQGGLLSNLSALANVTLALRYHADLFGLDDEDLNLRARQSLAELRVAQTDFHALPAHLSLGVRKRVALARALALNPNFVFLDDPDGGLDSATRNLVYERLERFRDDSGITVMIATNSRQLIDRLKIQPMELAHGHLLPEDPARRSKRA
ncbi:MAG TPA: ATP-binding cassette domain-containing protein [Polyangiaceae bacterium]|nr:ATP-binding cassette domain-containing protein [Polyangiaceae bacterium]